MSQPKPLWNPYAAGALLGAGLLFTFLTTGHGLGASGLPTAMAARIAHDLAPATTEANSYFGPMFAPGRSANMWIAWQMLGLALGALIGALTAGRFRFSVDGAPRLRLTRRLALAFAGGILAGFGARVAVGCTSGLGLSGSATLATAGFLFLMGFFGAGAGIGWLTRRNWQ